MPITLTIRDESASGESLDQRPLEFPTERITIRDLIRERVYQEVQDFNRKRDEMYFNGLVQPTDAEKVLNGTRTTYNLKRHREIDWKEQFDLAQEAFTRNGFFILIDDKQAEELDQEFTIAKETTVSFVKLTPLVGG